MSFEETYSGLDWGAVLSRFAGAQRLPGKVFERCTFRKCNLSRADLTRVTFEECEFADCDLSLAVLNGTAFRDVSFTNCKLLGLRFDDCNEFRFALNFSGCLLNHASFYGRRLQGASFRECSLIEADFVECDLHEADFDKADLRGALFGETRLEGADLRTAQNVFLDPEANRIRGAKFSLEGALALLSKYEIRIG